MTEFSNLLKKKEQEIYHGLEKEQEIFLEFAKHEREIFYRFFQKFIRPIIAAVIRFLWVGKVTGIKNIPDHGGAVIALNHASYFDFLCFSAVSPRPIHFLAAEKFFVHKYWRRVMKYTSQIKVDRDNPDKTEVFGQIYGALKQGRLIGIFPEGTRSPDGNMLKAYTGVAKIALKAKVPVIPVGLIGMHEILPKNGKFPRILKAHIHVGQPISLKKLHDLEHEDKHYSLVTDVIMHKIAGLSHQVYPHAEYDINALDKF